MLRLNLYLLFVILFLFASETSGQNVRFVFSIADENGRPVSTIQPSDVALQTKGAVVKPGSLSFVSDAPLNVVILIDVSTSQERMVPVEKLVADTFIGQELKPGRDKVGILTFSSDLGLVYDLGSDLSLARTRLKQIEFKPPPGFVGGGVVVSRPIATSQDRSGNTPLFDTINKVLGVVAKLKEDGRRSAILVFSDGVNTAGDKKLKEIIAASIKAETPIFAVGIGDPNYDGVDEKVLKRLTDPTGGMAVFPKGKNPDFSADGARLGAILRNFYVADFPAGTSAVTDAKVEIVTPALKKLQIFSTKNP